MTEDEYEAELDRRKSQPIWPRSRSLEIEPYSVRPHWTLFEPIMTNCLDSPGGSTQNSQKNANARPRYRLRMEAKRILVLRADLSRRHRICDFARER